MRAIKAYGSADQTGITLGIMKTVRSIALSGLFGASLALGCFQAPAHAANSQCNGLDPNTTPCADVSGADDSFTVTWTGGNNTNSATRRNCALSNVPVGSEMVDITINGTGAGGALEASGAGGTIPFVVQYRDASGGSWVTMTPGSASSFTPLNEATFNTCDNSGSSSGGQRMRIRIVRNDIDHAPAGVYTGTFTVTADPPGGGLNKTDASATVTITLNELMNFTRLKTRFDDGIWDFVGNEFNRDNSVCVWTNNRATFGGASSYDVTVTSDQGSFVLETGGNMLPYSVYWASDLGSNITVNNGTQLTYGSPTTFMTVGDEQSCPGGTNNAQMLVFWDEDDLSAAVGTPTPYTSVVTVEVSIPP